MRNVLAVAKRILQQFSHDPRTVVLFIVAPIVALWIFSVILSSPSYHPTLAAVDLPGDLVAALQNEEAELENYAENEQDKALAALAERQVDAVLTLREKTLMVQVEGSDPTKTAAVAETVQAAVRQAISDQRAQLSTDFEESFKDLEAQLKPLGIAPEQPSMELSVSDLQLSYLHGNDDWDTFDFIGPVFIVVFIFMFVFISSGMSLVTERIGGTLERLLVTPIKSWQLVAGYALGFGVVSLVQAGIVLWACLQLIGFPNEGALVWVFLLTFSAALASLTLGLLVSGLAKNGFQVVQLLLLFVTPQVLLSGIFDLSQAPQWMQVLSHCFPMSHAAEALRAVMLRGASLAEVGLDMAILWGFIVAFFVGATLSFNAQRAR